MEFAEQSFFVYIYASTNISDGRIICQYLQYLTADVSVEPWKPLISHNNSFAIKDSLETKLVKELSAMWLK